MWGNRISRVFDNVLDRKFKERTENEVLVTDITYLPTKSGFPYLSAVQDLYNNAKVTVMTTLVLNHFSHILKASDCIY